MRLIEALRRWYSYHETRTKIIAFLLFLVILASLYVIVLKPPSPADDGTALTVTTPSPTLMATSVATKTPFPSPVRPTATPPPPPIPLGPYQVTTQKNLPYGPTVNLYTRLDLCTPVNASGLRPGIILIHGGSFTGGDKDSYGGFCSAFASYGFVVAAVNYRLAPNNKWPAPIEDVQLAVRWLRANASANNLDPQRLCSLGDEAGGHLATFLGVLDTIYPGNEASLMPDQSPRTTCIVDEFGPVDLSALAEDDHWHTILNLMFDPFALQTNRALLGQASPVFSVSAQSAPALVIQGIQDQTVPQSQSQELQQAYEKAGAPVTYLSYSGGHEFSGLTPDQRDTINQQILAFLISQEQP